MLLCARQPVLPRILCIWGGCAVIWVYAVLSAALIPLLDNFVGILRQPYSWWLVPLLLPAFFVGFVLLHAAVFALAVLAVRLDKPARLSRFYRAMINSSLILVLKLARVHIHLTGEELLSEEGRYLFVINHTHLIDPAIVLAALPHISIAFVAKKEIYTEIPFAAKAMHAIGCIPLDRENNRAAVKSILTAVELIKDGKSNIAIFPEGTRSKDGSLMGFRDGAFKIATKSGADIAVCTLKGVTEITKNMFRRRTDVYFDIVKVIPNGETQGVSTHEIGGLVQKLMRENLDKRKS